METSQPTFNAYVDGLNLYKGVLEARPNLKWLDLAALCSAARPGWKLGKVFYFTAKIKELQVGDGKPQRQDRYLRALQASGVEVILGHFRKDFKWMTTASNQRRNFSRPALPSLLGLSQVAISSAARTASPNAIQVQVVKFEEKRSDVNLASELLRDSLLNRIAGALVISGDSDLSTPIRYAVQAGTNVRVLVPRRGQVPASLSSEASSISEIHPNDLQKFVFPRTVIARNGRTIQCPDQWK